MVARRVRVGCSRALVILAALVVTTVVGVAVAAAFTVVAVTPGGGAFAVSTAGTVALIAVLAVVVIAVTVTGGATIAGRSVVFRLTVVPYTLGRVPHVGVRLLRALASSSGVPSRQVYVLMVAVVLMVAALVHILPIFDSGQGPSC